MAEMSSHGMIIGLPRRWDEACFAIPALRAIEHSGLLSGIVLHEEQVAFFSQVTKLPQIVYQDRTRVKTLALELPKHMEASLAWEKDLSAEAFHKAGISKRFGPVEEIPKKWLTHPLEIQESPTEHRVRKYLNACELFGITTADATYFKPLDLGIPLKSSSILLVPDSDFGGSYEWSLEKWKELAAQLRQQGKKLSVAHFPQDKSRNLAKALMEIFENGEELVMIDPKSTGLKKLGSYETCVLADSSIAHIASFSGSRCVTLFGPNDTTWKRPLGRQHQVVKRHVECAPCLSAKCLMDARCQNELEVDRVLKAIQDLKV